MKSKISIMINTEAPAPSEPKQTIFEKVEEMERDIESNLIDSEYAMKYVACLYKKLCKCKRLRPEYRELKKKLKDIISKHGKYNNLVGVLDTGDSDEYTLDNGYDSDDY